MEPITAFITTLGFPIAAAAGIAFFFYKFLIRVMDENKQREEKYQSLLMTYGEQMAEISRNLAEIKNDICDIKADEKKEG